MAGGVVGRRVRRLVIARVVRGDLRRWAIYFGVSAAWRRYRKLAGKQPEVIFRRTVGPGAEVSMITTQPLPRKLQTKALRAALAADSRAQLARRSGAGGR